jgi:tryptophan synthase beta chain
MMFGMKSTIYMVRASYDQKPYRRTMIETYGGEVYPSPSDRTEFGRSILKKDPSNSGSLGISISEAAEDAAKSGNAKYTLGSVLNHVLLHQTVIGLETMKQMKSVDEYPDAIFGCVGGGSSFSGLYWPFYHDVVTGKAPKKVEFTAVESTACPKVTKGFYTYDHFDAARMTPMGKMHTIGHTFVPAPIHAGGLRYHGMAPTLCLLKKEGKVKSKAYDQIETLEAAIQFARTEGIIPAPEPSHAIKAVIDEALRCKQTGKQETILFLLCGHGYFDMQAYGDYLGGKLVPYAYPQEKIMASMRELKKLYPWLDIEPKING